MTDHHPADSDRFIECVARYLDGNLAEDDTMRLNETLRDDPTKRAQFVDFCIQSQLIREYGGACREDDGSPRPLSVDRAKVLEGRRTWRHVAMLSTLAAAILLAFVIVRRSPPDPSVASLSHVQGDVFVTRNVNSEQFQQATRFTPAKRLSSREHKAALCWSMRMGRSCGWTVMCRC